MVCVLMSIACVIATSLRRRRQKHVEFTSTMTSPAPELSALGYGEDDDDDDISPREKGGENAAPVVPLPMLFSPREKGGENAAPVVPLPMLFSPREKGGENAAPVVPLPMHQHDDDDVPMLDPESPVGGARSNCFTFEAIARTRRVVVREYAAKETNDTN